MIRAKTEWKVNIFFIYILIHSTFGEYYCALTLAFFVNIDRMCLLLAIETGHLRINEKEGRDFIKWTIIKVNVRRTELSGPFIPSSPLRQTASSLLMIPFPFTR